MLWGLTCDFWAENQEKIIRNKKESGSRFPRECPHLKIEIWGTQLVEKRYGPPAKA
jgi:hypothetical protein